MPDRLSNQVIRLTWKEWQDGRQAKKAALVSKGLSAPSRRTTARPEARAALERILSAPEDESGLYAVSGEIEKNVAHEL